MDILVIGAGGLGREVACSINNLHHGETEIEVVGFADDNSRLTEVAGLPVHPLSWISESNLPALCAIGDPSVKKSVIERIPAAKFARHISRNAVILGTAFIGEGCIICSGTQITTDIRIGRHVIINLNCTIGHDCTIGDFSTLSPGVHLSGHSYIGEGVFFGQGAVVHPGVKIGAWAKVGAGAVVTKDVPANKTVKGIPANYR
jgi:sugar O-acyltransferase (sialic acid O-acetyltransferase NeuD family)